MCKFSSKSGGVPFQPLGDLTWNDPITIAVVNHILYCCFTEVFLFVLFLNDFCFVLLQVLPD